MTWRSRRCGHVSSTRAATGARSRACTGSPATPGKAGNDEPRPATHPPRVRPELVAHGPSEVWSWDITALKGPQKGQWYKLYVVLDIFSRYVPGWLVAHAEDAVVAKDFLADAVARNLVIPHTIHADRGGSMTSKPVSEMMIDLGIRRSHSRPRTSNDNPFSPGAVQDPQIRARLPRPVRLTRRRTRVLRPIFPRL